MKDQKGKLLWSGRLDWTHDEDALKTLDIPAGVFTEATKLTVSNRSAVVDVTVNLGWLVKCHPAGAAVDKVWTATCDYTGGAVEKLITSAAHGLKHGDAIKIVDAGTTSFVAGTTYYVIGPHATAGHSTAMGTNTFCLTAVKGSDTQFDFVADGEITFSIAGEFSLYDSFTVEKWAAATSTTPVKGAETVSIDAWPDATGGQIQVAKSAATAGIFSVYAEIRRA